jgi:hypothetical protein
LNYFKISNFVDLLIRVADKRSFRLLLLLAAAAAAAAAAAPRTIELLSNSSKGTIRGSTVNPLSRLCPCNVRQSLNRLA